MFLIITALAAIVSTAVWYSQAPGDKYRVGLLSLMFWGATMMWFVDHVFAYLTEGGEFFEVNLDATMLGVCVVIVGLLVWQVILLISDPKRVFSRR